MNYISSFFQNKDYTVLNDKNEISSVKLNGIQRIFRKLGFYANTHLKVVSELAEKAFFKGNNWSNLEKDKMFQLIDKSRIGYVKIGEVKENTGKIIRYFGNVYGPDSYNFLVQVIDGSKPMREAYIHLDYIEKEEGKLGITALYEHFFPEHVDFIINKDDPLAKATYTFIAKILNDSDKLKGLKLIGNRVGGALLAQNYGFNGKIKEYRNINGVKIGDPHNLEIDKATAKKYADQCELKSPILVNYITTLENNLLPIQEY